VDSSKGTAAGRGTRLCPPMRSWWGVGEEIGLQPSQGFPVPVKRKTGQVGMWEASFQVPMVGPVHL
jgi:hypothetical protein